MFNFFKKTNPQKEKPSLDDVDLDIESIPGAVEIINGFPRINWSRVTKTAEAYSKHPAIDRIWTELAAQWLDIVSRHFGDRYRIREGERLLLLCA